MVELSPMQFDLAVYWASVWFLLLKRKDQLSE